MQEVNLMGVMGMMGIELWAKPKRIALPPHGFQVTLALGQTVWFTRSGLVVNTAGG
jgi:hypothetical protein